MDTGEGEKAGEPEPLPQKRQQCRYYSQGRHCSYGKKCKFLHVGDEVSAQERNTTTTPSQIGVEGPGVNEGQRPPTSNNSRAAPEIGRRPCRYFLSGHCTMEDRCRFWHPRRFPSVDDAIIPGNYTAPAQRMPVPRPSILQEAKLCDLTEELAKKLLETEINQLKKRFPKDQLIIQERSDGKVTYYRATVQATDPDWPFDLKEIDIMVSFPDNYPQEIFTLDVPLDQDLPPTMAKYVQQASMEWLQAKHATNQLLGKVELLFRHFLHWLDRSLERLFTEGARQLKKDIDLEKAGIQFIPYQELQAIVSEKSQIDDLSGTALAADKDASNEGKIDVVGSMDEDMLVQQENQSYDESQHEQEEATHLVENIKISDPRRGTEMKLMGLRLGENTATVAAQQITLWLQCNRCKVTADLTLTGRTPCTAQCEKCNASINATFRPCLLHHYSDVLGYLDLHNAVPADLVLQDCILIVGCLSCSQEGLLQNLSYGQTKEFNCEHCNEKISIFTESTKFQYIQPRVIKTDSNAANYKKIRDPAVQKGKPLPENGTCSHFRQSHRWLRFPCCGRAYPCDVCHDTDQDHPMELANRMLCGFCAKEQPYANRKNCTGCGRMMTHGAHTSHWEGGQGCRNKVKMSRNDRQKYNNINKTVSKKATNEKK